MAAADRKGDLVRNNQWRRGLGMMEVGNRTCIGYRPYRRAPPVKVGGLGAPGEGGRVEEGQGGRVRIQSVEWGFRQARERIWNIEEMGRWPNVPPLVRFRLPHKGFRRIACQRGAGG